MAGGLLAGAALGAAALATTTQNIAGALAGIIGGSTASFYLLNPAGIPFEPLPDLVPGITPLRVTYDMIDQEQAVFEYDVTEHVVQSLGDISSNIRARLKSVTVVGTFSGVPPLTPTPIAAFEPDGPVSFFLPPAPSAAVRLDLLRAAHLQAIADKKRPIMMVTPRVSLPMALITSVQQTWSPPLGESLTVAVTVRELKLVFPLAAPAVAPDYSAQLPGNNAAVGGGQSATTEFTGTLAPSSVPGGAPTSPRVVGVAP